MVSTLGRNWFPGLFSEWHQQNPPWVGPSVWRALGPHYTVPSLEMPAPKTTGFGAPLQVSLTEPSSADLRSEVSGSCHHLWQKEQMKLFPSNPSAGLCWKPLPARNLTRAGETRFMPQEQGRSRINSSWLRPVDHEEVLLPLHFLTPVTGKGVSWTTVNASWNEVNKTAAKRPSDTSQSGDFWTVNRHFFHFHRLHMEKKQGGVLRYA